ncbi:hypothetical protein LCGC14_1705090 [marine sediment metagenome]|uniref:DUF1353 domain-containing protein n=1 Tax=marine sediment metagenome TaxID=412755 RepID=A0A0F9KGZ3_9ZZZZ
MSSFTKPLTVTKISARMWEVERTFSYHVGNEDSIEVIQVFKGFQTDFASVPRIFWWLFPPDGLYTQAAVLHDFLYLKQIYTRKRSDYIFYEAMGVLGVPKWKRWTMWASVRSVAWLCWNKRRK